MNSFRKAIFCLVLLTLSTLVMGQGATTGAIKGMVTDRDNNPLQGAVVGAVHEPTGTRYSKGTRADGRLHIFNIRVGGPYTVTVTMGGFKTQQKNNLFVKLGASLELDFKLTLDSVEETLIVVAESNPIINSGRTGASTNVSTEAIERLPTISRSFSDFTRLSPYFDTTNEDTGAQSAGGRNNRYNNIQIDGAANNDLFGLAASGTPGGQAETQPISLDAIAEFQVVVSPYDVRQGGFTGGGVNAITRTGSNQFEGSIFHYTRSEDFVGDGVDGSKFTQFDQTQTGFRVGGPIVKDKIFFFVNGEISRREQPSDFLIDGSGSERDFGGLGEAQRFLDILNNTYGYDPGGFGEYIRATDSDKFFFRLDFNLNANHNLTVRHNFVDAVNDVDRRSRSRFRFPDNQYNFESETNSTVIQLNSTFGNIYNEARLSYQTIRDNRGGSTRFPQVEVSVENGTLYAGRENFSTANALDQDIIEFTNDLTFFAGAHSITVGTHNEFFKFDNLFIRDNFGTYRFDDLDDFENGVSSRLDYSFSATSDPQQSAKFKVNQLGFYITDQWSVNANLNLTMGLRADIPLIPDEPSRNTAVEQAFNLRTDINSGGNILWSPRLGFNWDVFGDGTTQIRGGSGVFSGRPPYVWISNQFSNTGIEFNRVRLRPGRNGVDEVNFNPNPDTQEPGSSFFTNEVNLIAEDFDFPQIWRTTLAIDQVLPWWGLIGTIEGMYSDTLKDVQYQNINIIPDGNLPAPDGRPNFQPNPAGNGQFGRVLLLTNTDKGYQWTMNGSLEKPLSHGFSGKFSYTTSRAMVINDGTSSQASSNWRRMENTGDINNLPLSVSDFQLRHRYFLAVSWQKDFFNGAPTLISGFYNVRSGRPYSTTYAASFRDVNGDGEGFTTNDLIYVPAVEGDVVLDAGTTWADLDAFISGDPALDAARGTIISRNSSREPWSQNLDLRIAQDVPIRGTKIQLSLDVLNFLNFVNDDWGIVEGTSFSNDSPIDYRGLSDDGRPIYRLLRSRDADTGEFNRFQVDNVLSRWRMQFGLRWTF